jgi:hypothetical protein
MLETADSHAVPALTHGLFVVPNGRSDVFYATIRGHEFELADPDSGHALAPTRDDLLVSSIASDLAWSAKRFLRTRRLPDEVSVYAEWRTHEGLAASRGHRREDYCVQQRGVGERENGRCSGEPLRGAISERAGTRPYPRFSG